jgi:Retrotransposon gag protein
MPTSTRSGKSADRPAGSMSHDTAAMPAEETVVTGRPSAADEVPPQVLNVLAEMMKKLEGLQVQIDAVVRNGRDAVLPITADSRSETSTQDRGHEEYKAVSKTTGARGVKGQDPDDSDDERSMGNDCKGRRSRSKNKSAKNSRKNTRPEYHEPLAEQIPPTDLIRLYRHSLQNVVVRKVLDPMFPAAKMAWDRLRRQYPMSWTIARATLAAAFEERAATVYEEVAAANTGANEWEFWNRLEARLFNASQVSIKRAEFEKASQGARETVDEFADRIRQLAGCLPEATPDAVLCSRFLNGVAIGLRREATIADRGDFDNLVSTSRGWQQWGRAETNILRR